MKKIITHIFFVLFLIIPAASSAGDAVLGWGNNGDGQVAPLKFKSKVIDFDVGPWAACAVLDNGNVVCQGCAHPLNNFRQCDTKIKPSGWIMEFGGMRTTERKMKNISTAYGHSCGINEDGVVECWGCEPPRQGFQCHIPESVNAGKAMIAKDPLYGLRTIDVSEMSSCVVMSDGRVQCWGCEEPENYGQCSAPKDIRAKGVSVSLAHSCAVLEGGGVQCWGSNKKGELNAPSALKDVKDISSAQGYSAAVSAAGELFLWGAAAPGICEQQGACAKVRAVSAAADYLCITYLDGRHSCVRTKTDHKDAQEARDRSTYKWLADKDVEALSADAGVTMALVRGDVVDKNKDRLPSPSKILNEDEYMRGRKVLSAPPAFSDARFDFKNHVGMKFVTIPKGDFKMGSCNSWWSCLFSGYTPDPNMISNEKPLRTVSIRHDFQMGIFEVTVGDFKKFVAQKRLDIKKFPGVSYLPDYYPASKVSWFDAKEFVKWLNETKPASDKGVYRLPSEAEWEYSARAGTKTIYWQGDSIEGKATANCAGCIDTKEPGPMPVGSFKPNAFGLFDVIGNVDEWVEDCVGHQDYSGAPKDGRAHVYPGCNTRGARGGSWEYRPESSRSAWRDWYTPQAKTWEQGFRVVRDNSRW
jgi:formylglycine-generating enzyme required for sulfatase activity